MLQCAWDSIAGCNSQQSQATVAYWGQHLTARLADTPWNMVFKRAPCLIILLRKHRLMADF